LKDAQLATVARSSWASGTELITVEDDRTFASDTGFWAKDGAATISGGTANFPQAGHGIHHTLLTPGKTYQITFAVTAITGGSVFWLTSGSIGIYRTAPGTYTEIATMAGDTLYIGMVPGQPGSASIDNVSVKEVATIFNADLGASQSIRAISLYKHNLTDAAQVRITGSDNSDMSSPAYSGVWVTVPTAITGYQKVYTLVLTANTTARYWRVEIDDPTNPDGYVQLARVLFVPLVFQPTLNMSYGAGIVPATDTAVERSLGGVNFFDRRDPYRSCKFSLNHLTLTEGMQNLDLQMDLGIDGELLFLFDAAATGQDLMRTSFLGTLKQLSAIEFPYLDRNSVAYEVQEIL
jgi:hypothetical protein